MLLANDGSILGFPYDQTQTRLNPGESYTFSADTFLASPPFNVEDVVLVFGVKENNPIDWARLTEEATTRGQAGKSGLSQALQRHLLPGQRGGGPQFKEHSPWVLTGVKIRVVPQGRDPVRIIPLAATRLVFSPKR